MNKKLNTERLTRKPENAEGENAVASNRWLYFFDGKEMKSELKMLEDYMMKEKINDLIYISPQQDFVIINKMEMTSIDVNRNLVHSFYKKSHKLNVLNETKIIIEYENIKTVLIESAFQTAEIYSFCKDNNFIPIRFTFNGIMQIRFDGNNPKLEDLIFADKSQIEKI